MGLSASQARLLSITRRLNNNELQSEFIANSKIRLSSQNVTASEKYIAALDATKLDYISYNDSGVEQTVALTFNALNNYNPLKNQYTIYNTEGQLYVSATDAANFRASNDLHQFLDKYGLFDQSDAENEEANAAYEADLALWEQEYIYDSTTNTATEVKSLMQKAIDMMYIIKHQSEFGSELTADKMLNVLDNFTDGDMKNLTTPPTPPPEPDLNYPQPEPTFEEVLRDKPQKPIDTDRIYDKPKAQWYTNLWYAMNGQSTSDEVYSVYDENAEFSYFTVTDTEKTCDPDTSNQNYVVIDDSLASDSNWLQFALTNGMVTISQTTLKNDTNSTNIRWEGIEFTSTSDITEVADDSKIAKAEAEYEKTMQEIQIEDKKLEQQMTKLDTEHSALEKELESIKGVMDKNTERSFAAFS